MSDDSLLLRQFIATRDQEAFAALVRRYVDLVYSAARRQVREDAAAQDVTQQVFVLLAERAGTIRDGEAVAGWLLVTTRYVALNAMRSEQRRRRHEREAAAMYEKRAAESSTVAASTTAAAWDRIGPMLDEAVGRLKREDRDALALRYFQGRSVADVAAALGVSQDAAQKRLGRALEKLRELFARRGVTTSAEALSSVLMANALIVAPAALGSAVAGAAMTAAATAAATSASAATTASSMKGAAAIMAVAKAKLAAASVAAAVVVGATGTIAYQQFTTPTGKSRQVRVDPSAAATAAAPTFEATTVPTTGTVTRFVFSTERLADGPWRERFEAVYRLGPDDVVKLVQRPWIPERLPFHQDRVGPDSAGATALMIQQDRNGALRVNSTLVSYGGGAGDGGYGVADAIRTIAGIAPQEIDLPHKLMKTELQGDLVYRPDGSPPEQRLAALLRIIAPAAGRTYELVQRSVEREVIVVSGAFKAQPIAGATSENGRPTIHLFVSDADLRLPDGVGGGSTSVQGLLNNVSDIAGYPVVVESVTGLGARVNYRQQDSVVAMEAKREGPAPAAEVDALLASVAKQTSLQLRRERRTILMWVEK